MPVSHNLLQNLLPQNYNSSMSLLMYHVVSAGNVNYSSDRKQLSEAVLHLTLLAMLWLTLWLCQPLLLPNRCIRFSWHQSIANILTLKYRVSTKKVASLFFGNISIKSSPNVKRKVSFEICSFWGFQNCPWFSILAK